MNTILEQLAAPFRVEHIEWKPGSTTKDNTKCLAMAYADLRAYMERLDEVCGIDWSVEYQPWGDSRIIARLTIAGVTRSSTGESDAQDAKNGLAGTVAEAQAFKRAAAMFGLGRSLYDLPSVWVEYDGKKITEKGQAQLNSSYKQWYARTVAKTPQQPATPAASDANPFVDVEFDRPRATPAQIEEIEALGRNAYGAEYNGTKLAEWKSGGARHSIETLFEMEAATLIKALRKKISDDAAQPEAVAA